MVKSSPILNEDLAEFYGALIGDGCLSKFFSVSDNRFRFCTLLTGHTHDEKYYRDTIQPIVSRTFNVKGHIGFRKEYNSTIFVSYSKPLFDSIYLSGFPIGKKGNITIPNQISSKNNLALACIRGIFDTDGSVYNRYSKRYNRQSKLYFYKNIQFKMNSLLLLKQIQPILEKNKIKTSSITKSKNSYVLRIYDQSSVNLFFEKVKPSNQYHIERFLNQN